MPPPVAPLALKPADSGAPAALEVRGLAKYFGGLKAVDGVDFTVRRGAVHALIGPNGSGKTFQNIRLFRSMTALENVVIGAERDGNVQVAHRRAALEARARAALDFVGLGARADEVVTRFSYGHQRLIEIARALAANPTVLLLDEPAAGLNSSEKKSLHDLLDKIAAQGLTILIIDHDMTLVAGVAERLTVLNFGRRIADGDTAGVLQHPDVVAAYLGVG